MKETIVIYHGGCRDGFCAAWIYNRWNRDIGNIAQSNHVEYHPGYYGNDPPDIEGKDVVILDFAYSPEVMGNIALHSNHLLWIDHHKTALPVIDVLKMINKSDRELLINQVSYFFDLNKSGAGLTWDHFFPGQQRPLIVDYVEDRDLWKKQLEFTDEINAYIACLEFNFHVWDTHSHCDKLEMLAGGNVALMKTDQYVREVCKNVYFADVAVRKSNSDYTDKIFNHIPIVNICQVDCSEVLHELCKIYTHAPFSLYWFKRKDGFYQYGMRSIGDFDVSEVAKAFGGGGHKNAAGFQLMYLLDELK